MWIERICWVAFLITPAVLSSPAAAEPAMQTPQPLLGVPSPDLASTPQMDTVLTSRRVARLEPSVSPIATLGAVAYPSRTVFMRPGAQALPGLSAASMPQLIEASNAPEQILSSQDAEPLPNVSEAEPLMASLPADAVAEKSFRPEAVSRGTILSEPLTIVISLKDQKLDVYRGLDRIETTRISSGKRGYDTLTGVFGILQKKREHYSNLYDSAPMPYMQRLTRSGTALHAGPVPNYPASHGCVRMPPAFAPKLFRMTEIGGKVAMMSGRMVAPEPIEHPALFNATSSSKTVVPTAEDSVAAGAKTAARAVAQTLSNEAEEELTSEAPLRLLVTRREERDVAILVQQILASMGYLDPQDEFVGYMGEGTKKAIMAFEKDHGLPQKGRLTEAIAAKIYETAGQGPLPDAYLFLRKGFRPIRHVPVTLKDPHKKLGTHLFTYMRPSDGGAPQWIGISLEGDDSKSVLDRITIPDDMREEISEGLTSGATFIIADKGMHSSVLPEGDDFIVRTNDSPVSNPAIQEPKPAPRVVVNPQKKSVVKKRIVRQEIVPTQNSTVTRTRGFRLFSRRR